MNALHSISSSLHVFTFGDSVLDCERYSGAPDPGTIVAKALNAELHHLADDGATSKSLAYQFAMVEFDDDPMDIALVSVGGNDYLTGALSNTEGILGFSARLGKFLNLLPASNIYIANVYDPSFGNDEEGKRLLGIEDNGAALARFTYTALNTAIKVNAEIRGAHLIDLATLFAKGDETWFSSAIEPSRIGADKIAEAFLLAIRP